MADERSEGTGGSPPDFGPGGLGPAGFGPGGLGPGGFGPGGFGHSRYQLGPDDRPTAPVLFTQPSAPPDFWEEPQQLGTAGAVDVPERRDRRRRAFLAVGLVALATVVVVAAALLIGPHLGGHGNDRQAGPAVTPTGSPTSSGAASGAPTSAAASAPTAPGEATSPGGATGNGAPAPSVRTVTVTAGSTGGDPGDSTRSGGSSARTSSPASSSTAPSSTAPSSPAPSSTASSSTPARTTPVGAPGPFGVPVQQISCGDGYIVQLASELTSKALVARIADLKGRGMVPADAKVADSAHSCKLFTNQTNTFILYAGPFQGRYGGCADRIAGPYDAFIRGANPKTSADFVSCICPAPLRSLPRLDRSSAPSQWIGELQRMLAAHLRYSIPDLGVGAWGTYTADTSGAVRRFQSDQHLKATGTVDGRTWAALQRAGC